MANNTPFILRLMWTQYVAKGMYTVSSRSIIYNGKKSKMICDQNSIQYGFHGVIARMSKYWQYQAFYNNLLKTKTKSKNSYTWNNEIWNISSTFCNIMSIYRGCLRSRKLITICITHSKTLHSPVRPHVTPRYCRSITRGFSNGEHSSMSEHESVS